MTDSLIPKIPIPQGVPPVGETWEKLGQKQLCDIIKLIRSDRAQAEQEYYRVEDRRNNSAFRKQISEKRVWEFGLAAKSVKKLIAVLGGSTLLIDEKEAIEKEGWIHDPEFIGSELSTLFETKSGPI